jgi:hypothetical protein
MKRASLTILASAFAVLSLQATGIAAAADKPAAASHGKPAVELKGLDRLLAMEDMKNLRLTFCRSLDTHDWTALRATMSDDFSLYWTDTAGPNGAPTRAPIEMTGADKFVTFAQQILGQGKSIHICTMPQFEYVGKDRARALWFINGYGQIGELSGLGYERLVDDYVRVNGKWLIQRAEADIEVQSFTSAQGTPVPAPQVPGK